MVDFASLAHDTLYKHAVARLTAWEGEGYECRLVEDWPLPDDDDVPIDLFPFEHWDEGKQGELF